MFKAFTRNTHLIAVAAIVLLTVLTYVRGAPNQFVAEDFYVIARGSYTLPEMLSASAAAVRVRPVLDLFEYLTVRASGSTPLGCHLATLFLHTAVTVLFYVLMKRLSKSTAAGVAAALLFAVYPRHHQTVLWFSADPFLLMTLFSLLCIYSFMRYMDTNRARWLAGSVAAFAFGLVSHEAALFVLPLLVAVAAFLYRPRLRDWLTLRTYLRYVPFAVLALLWVLVNISGTRAFKVTGDASLLASSDQTYGLMNLGASTVRDMLAYLTYWMLPHIPLRSLDPNAATVALALGVLAVMGMLLWRGTPLVRLGVVWGVLTLLPYVLLVPFGNADRYFYMAAAGWAIMVTAAAQQAAVRLRPIRHLAPVSAALAAAYVFVSLVFIQQRIDEWRIAGELAAGIVDRAVLSVPDPHPDDTMLFANLPGTYGQAYVFHTGIIPALEQRYGANASRIHIYQTNDPETCTCVTDMARQTNPSGTLHVFLYSDDTLSLSNFSPTMTAQLHPERWFPPVTSQLDTQG